MNTNNQRLRKKEYYKVLANAIKERRDIILDECQHESFSTAAEYFEERLKKDGMSTKFNI